jgi:membrane-bound serine protease (ClpP class)
MLPLAFLLFGVGILLVVIELFIPSMGILGLSAATCFVASVVLGFLEGTGWGIGLLAGVAVLVPVLLALGFKIFPHTPIGRLLILSGPDRTDIEPGSDVSSEPLHALVGRTGRTVSTLRPAGVVEIEGRRVDVVTEGEWVDPGREVVVTEVEGNRAVVRAVEPSSAAGDPSTAS